MFGELIGAGLLLFVILTNMLVFYIAKMLFGKKGEDVFWNAFGLAIIISILSFLILQL